MQRGDRVKAGPNCAIAPQEPYVEAWINEGVEGTVASVLEFVEFAEARPVEVGSKEERLLRACGGRERRRYHRLLVRFDVGITIRVDADLVVAAR